MKKINFNDRYGQTEAVLEKRMTMMRRGIKWDMLCDMREDSIDFVVSEKVLLDGRQVFIAYDVAGNPIGQAVSAYHIGEEVAVAQSYSFLYNHMLFYTGKEKALAYRSKLGSEPELQSGWSNKMFVRADLMPHRIRITNIRVERLQDISDEDCMREGIMAGEQEPRMFGFRLPKGTILSFLTPRAAFSALFDRVNGKGTWERNPWVFVYEFELAK